MSLHDTRRTNFVLSEILIWTKYLQFTLQKMYDVFSEIDEEKEAVKEDLAVAEADLNTRAEQIKTAHIEALKEADERSRTLERTKAESDRLLKAEINRLSRQLTLR